MLKRRDILFIGSLLFCALALLLFTKLTGTRGGEAVVRIDGEVQARYPLAVDGIYLLNNGTNTLCIENGAARMLEATCPDQICVRQGTVDKANQTITCLPNRLTVTIEGRPEEAVTVG